MNADCRYSLLTIVNAFLQLAKATRLVGFSVMQFTIDLNVKKMHQPELKSCKHVRTQESGERFSPVSRSCAYMWETCVDAQPMLNTAAKKL